MRFLVNSREMRQYDKNTTEFFKVPSLILMEQAAIAACEEIVKSADKKESILIVCGNGNNGGDGLAIGRLLLLKGYDIDLVLSGHDHIYTRSGLMRGNEKVKSGGTLYIEANTASGCNYDGQPDKTPWYAEKCIQLRTPTYVLLNFSEGKISIKALRSDTNEIFDSYELIKSAPSKTEYKDSLLQKIYLFFVNRIFELRDIIF